MARKVSQVVSTGNQNHKISKVVKSFDMMLAGAPEMDVPSGLFGRVVVVKTDSTQMSLDDLDIEFDIPFDDDTEANEAEISVYNLSQTTINTLSHDSTITVTAGYKGDTGVIFTGHISKVGTKREGVDKKTTIYAIDDTSLQERQIVSRAYKAGTTASYILKDLLGLLKLPIAVFKVKKNPVLKDDTTVDGNLMENIRNYAQMCGVSAYISKGKIYARDMRDGDDINLIIDEDSGLIGSPEPFEEEVSDENTKTIVKGVKCEMLLQHRVTTAIKLTVKSLDTNGTYRVRSGKHICTMSDFKTEAECIV